MMGTPRARAYRATLYTAEPCARPHAHTSCVVQMEPMPMPTRSASAPASIRLAACCRVTTLPAITSMSGYAVLTCLIISCW